MYGDSFYTFLGFLFSVLFATVIALVSAVICMSWDNWPIFAAIWVGAFVLGLWVFLGGRYD